MSSKGVGIFVFAAAAFIAAPAQADSIGWPQPGGSNSPVVLTYSFSNLFDGDFNTSLSEGEIRRATAMAFAIWARHAPLHFTEIADPGLPVGEAEYPVRGMDPDIRIGYMDSLPQNEAAHAHLPFAVRGPQRSGIAGDVHFSNDLGAFGARTWGAAAQGPFVLDFFSAMLHEVGHTLGLYHLADTSAVMGTVFLVFDDAASADLLPADIAAIRALYGIGVGSIRTLDDQVILTPEPATLTLIATGLCLLRVRARRARS